MKPRYVNKTNLTLDMYSQGIISSYKASHKLLRIISAAYAIIMLFIAFAGFLYFDWIICIPFLALGLAIIFWNIWGYKLGTKKSFMKFAKLHSSHYQVEMEYRFYEDRLEQETSKTELAVMYNEFDIVYELDKILIIIFNKKVIVMDKNSFVDADSTSVIEFLKEKSIKVTRSKA